METQLGILADHGIRKDLIFSDVASGRTMNRTGWMELMHRIQPSDTIAVAFLDRFSRNFEEGVRIQAELTGRDIGIVAIRESIDTTMTVPHRSCSGGRCWPRAPIKWTLPVNG